MLDANSIVSGTIVAVGVSAQILDAARAEQFALITSRDIVTEVLRTLARPRVQRKYPVGSAEIGQLRFLLEHDALLVPLSVDVHGVATHPEDDRILATAASGNAQYIVTGDRQLQKLGSFGDVAIVSPRQFLAILQAELDGDQDLY